MPWVRKMTARPLRSFQQLVLRALAQGELVALNLGCSTTVPQFLMPMWRVSSLVKLALQTAVTRETCTRCWPGISNPGGGFWGDSPNVISLQQWETLRAVHADNRPRSN